MFLWLKQYTCSIKKSSHFKLFLQYYFNSVALNVRKQVKFPEIDFLESNPLQSNLSNTDTEGTEGSVCLREVSVLQRFFLKDNFGEFCWDVGNVRNIEVSVPRGSTVVKQFASICGVFMSPIKYPLTDGILCGFNFMQ